MFSENWTKLWEEINYIILSDKKLWHNLYFIVCTYIQFTIHNQDVMYLGPKKTYFCTFVIQIVENLRPTSYSIVQYIIYFTRCYYRTEKKKTYFSFFNNCLQDQFFRGGCLLRNKCKKLRPQFFPHKNISSPLNIYRVLASFLYQIFEGHKVTKEQKPVWICFFLTIILLLKFDDCSKLISSFLWNCHTD